MDEDGSTVNLASGSRNEETRRRNLSAIMRTVHYSGPTSRADLTKLTGLNRSTIKVLVDELVAGGIAFESHDAENSTVGRPSPLVNLSDSIVAIAANPDVDAVVVGCVGLGGVVHERVRIETKGAPTVAEAARLTADVAAGMAGDGREIVGVGVAVPGLVRHTDHVVVDAPHLGWHQEDIATAFAKAVGVPTWVDNDASAGLLAESRFGSAIGDNVVFINGSTSGIGGAVVLGGRLLQGASGFAGEIGHTMVTPGGEECRCGRRGCLETEVNLARLAAAAGDRALDPDRLGEVLAHDMPPALAAEVDRQIDVLAVAIVNSIANFNPSSVVLGGFVGALHDYHSERLEEAVERESFREPETRAELVRATLREQRLMLGGAELAFASLLRDPSEWWATNGPRA